METWTLIISAAALAVSLYTYFAHDRRLKQQERLINSYQLKQLQEEEQANKKADIRVQIKNNTKGVSVFHICNRGRAIARNIRVEGLNVKGFDLIEGNIFPCEMMYPQDYMELEFWETRDCPRKLTLKLIWDDESGQDNVTTKVITL